MKSTPKEPKAQNLIQPVKPEKTVKASSGKPARRLSTKKPIKASTHSRKHKAPPKLEELIELVNLLPKDRKTPAVEVILKNKAFSEEWKLVHRVIQELIDLADHCRHNRRVLLVNEILTGEQALGSHLEEFERLWKRESFSEQRKLFEELVGQLIVWVEFVSKNRKAMSTQLWVERESMIDQQKKLDRQLIEDLPLKLREYIQETSRSKNWPESVEPGVRKFAESERFVFLVNCKNFLGQIADWICMPVMVNGQPDPRYKLPPDIANTVAPDLSVQFSHDMKIAIDGEGHLVPQPIDLLQQIELADLRRIRRCPICNDIFWAERIDQKCCSKPKTCAKKLRDQSHNKNYPDRYKLRRIEKANKAEAERAAKTHKGSTKTRKGKHGS